MLPLEKRNYTWRDSRVGHVRQSWKANTNCRKEKAIDDESKVQLSGQTEGQTMDAAVVPDCRVLILGKW